MAKRGNGAGTLIKTKTGLFIAKWTYQGKTFTRSTKSYDRTEAEEKLDEFVKPFTETNNIAVLENLEAKVRTIQKTETTVQDLNKPERISFKGFTGVFLDDIEYQDLEETTKKQYRSIINCFCIWINEKHSTITYLDEVSESIAKEYLTSLSKRVLSGTYNQCLAVFKRVFSVVIGKENVWMKFKYKMVFDKNEKRALTKDEVLRVLSMVENKPHLKIIFTLAVYTGLRMSDCSLIKWNNVDFENRIIHLVPKKTKRLKKEVFIPMHDSVYKLLFEIKGNAKDEDYVSPKNARCYLQSGFQRTIVRILKKCGIKKESNDWIGMHIFRHTFVSMCANAGVPLAIVQSIVGHSCEEMTKRYYHMDNSMALKAVQKIQLAC